MKKDSSVTLIDTVSKNETEKFCFIPCSSDSLKELAMLISGKKPEGEAKYLGKIYFASKQYKTFADNFEKKWYAYDSSRIKQLIEFRKTELAANVGTTKKLFYPFSGPDILYGYTFFPDADEYIMMGLEPIGTLPIYDNKNQTPDSYGCVLQKSKHFATRHFKIQFL